MLAKKIGTLELVGAPLFTFRPIIMVHYGKSKGLVKSGPNDIKQHEKSICTIPKNHNAAIQINYKRDNNMARPVININFNTTLKYIGVFQFLSQDYGIVACYTSKYTTGEDKIKNRTCKPRKKF